MSDYRDKYFRLPQSSSTTELFICLFSTKQQLTDSVTGVLSSDRYQLECFSVIEDLEKFVWENSQKIDCLILTGDGELNSAMERFWQQAILLPTIIVEIERSMPEANSKEANSSLRKGDTVGSAIYHRAELRLYPPQLTEIHSYINLAITRFISLAPNSKRGDRFTEGDRQSAGVEKSLVMQQQRLTEKIKDRLGYLGVYYKRDPNAFYPNLSTEEQENLYRELSSCYRQIALNYFDEDSAINQLIDKLVDRAFFANISTSQILEIHMDLIDEFSQQLKIEGRNDDILLDYRLPLIDVIAHLCEIYRRSISEKDLSLELLFAVE